MMGLRVSLYGAQGLVGSYSEVLQGFTSSWPIVVYLILSIPTLEYVHESWLMHWGLYIWMWLCLMIWLMILYYVNQVYPLCLYICVCVCVCGWWWIIFQVLTKLVNLRSNIWHCYHSHYFRFHSSYHLISESIL